MTLKRALRGAVVRSVLMVAALGLGYGVVSVTHDATPRPMPASPADPTPAASAAQALAQGERCWSGGDGHPIPSKVIYRKGDGDWRLGGRAAVGRALGQIFDGQDAGMTVFKFCE